MGEEYDNLQVLSEINEKTISQFSLDDTYQTLVDIGCQELGIDYGALFLTDNGQLEVKAICGLNNEYFKLHYSLSNSILKKAKSEILIVDNLQQAKTKNKYSQDLFIAEGFKSLLAAPIFVDDELEGLLLFLHSDVNYFSQEDFLPVETITTQAPLVIKKAKIFQKMERNVAGLSILQRTSSTINSTLNLEEVFNLTVDVIMGTMGVSMSGLFLLDESKENLNLVASTGVPGGEAEEKLIAKTQELCWRVIENKEAAIEDEIPDEHNELDTFNMKSGMIIPLIIRGEVIGAVAAGQVGFKRNFTEADTRFVTTLANQIAIAIENARMYNQMEELATKDGLTKLYNHSHFQEILAKEIEKAKRYERDLSLLMMDIDNFKDFNDTYGHQVGDEVLKELARLLKKEARESDIVARYGGEEFAVILPETDLNGAVEMGKRLNKAIRNMVIKYEGLEIKITVSIGASSYHEGKSQKKLINDSDDALYQAKDHGKDQTCAKEFCALEQ
ncbi:sensor domain-containing diguanylate cyclase [Halanaerobacter jeridensis]|uniref:Diguanylate cyclase (GGDEF)-like protein n=1 Tax=Halanaerobacter jeridensis TaxID=706427 RepID=A0A938XR81_9FIRM|nr:diguanylate cyclase [Halanaerobacter jeridensis]MBM7555940.1 diguanylate cyclase (GGDEF)-like protein [Halanaerobacter jeridensis]